MAPRSFAVVSLLLCCSFACAACTSSVRNDECSEEKIHQVDEDSMLDEVGLLQTKAVVEKESSKDVSPPLEQKSVTNDFGNVKKNRICGLFGCRDPPAQFVISKRTLKYVEIDLKHHNHSLTDMPKDDLRLDFVTSHEAMQDLGHSLSNAISKQMTILSTKFAAAQKQYHDEYRKLHPNENSTAGWNWDWKMKDDPAEFVDGDAPDWEAKIRLVRPGLSDADYKLGKALYAIAHRSKWNPFDPFGIGQATVDAMNDAGKAVNDAVNNVVQSTVDVVNQATSGLTFFVDLGQNMIKVVEELQSLIDCMNNLPEKYKLTGMVEFAVGVAQKPGGLIANLIPDMWNEYMTPFIDGSRQFIDNQLSAGNYKLDNSLSIGDQVFEKIKEFAKIPGMEALGCITDHVIEPAFNAVADTIDSLVDLIVKPVTEVFNKFVTASNGFVAKFVSKAVDLIQTTFPVTEAIGKVAKAQSQDFCFDEMTRIKEGKPRRSTSEKILIVGTATLSEFLEKFFNDGVNSLFRPILENAVEFVGQLLETGLHALDGLCGLIPEAGAAVCALVSNIVGGGYNLASHGLLQGGLSFMTSEGDSIIQQSSTFFANQAESALTKVTVPDLLVPFVPLIQSFATTIDDQINNYLGQCDTMLPPPS